MTELSAFAEVQGAFERGDHSEVLRLTDAILAERPGDDAAHELRARALLALGRTDDAEVAAENAVRLDPDEIRYHELLAEVLAARGSHRDAADEYRRLAATAPRLAEWTVAEARERLGAAQPEMGTEAARRALRLDPGNATAQLALAQGLTRLGQPRPALQAALQAVELRPDDPATKETLADAQWLAGETSLAFHGYRALLSETTGDARTAILRKARTLYRQRAGWLGRLLAGPQSTFELALRLGWLHVP